MFEILQTTPQKFHETRPLQQPFGELLTLDNHTFNYIRKNYFDEKNLPADFIAHL